MNRFLSRTDFDFKGKIVLVRIDCDVDLRSESNQLVVDEDFRLKSAIPTIKLLLERGAGKVILMGHLDKPGGKVVPELSLEPVVRKLRELLEGTVGIEEIGGFEGWQITGRIFLLENLRFNKGEEENDEEFAKKLACLGDVYVNEAFGNSHREHASIVSVPKFLPSFLGIRFEKEVRELALLRQGYGRVRGIEIKRPLIFVLGGSKEDKLSYLGFLSKWADKVLVGGRLPLLISNSKFLISKQFLKLKIKNLKFVLAELNTDKKDIDEESIRRFKSEIEQARTLLWAGPMGVYEEPENQKGTFEIAKAIAESKAFKIAGGGDTHRVLSMLSLWKKFDFVSVGGGAMLYFLKEGTLPGIEAVGKQ